LARASVDLLRWSVNVLSVVLVLITQGAQNPAIAQTPSEIEEALKGLSWRSIGPAEMGGRTVDIAGIPGDPTTVYMATGSGGLWKTVDGGTTWKSMFESGNTLSLGAVEIAPSDLNVVYVGTGEHNPRNSMSIGDGVYRSTDRGRTWKHIGLTDTERIGRIRVHPHDPDLVYVAAMGHAWGANEQRGVFRSTDGGGTWENVLYVDENTGAVDLIINPDNPRVLFAAMYDYRPTAAQSHWATQVQNELDAVLARLEEVLQTRLANLNQEMNEAGVPRVIGGV
jgi:photosystem II stability/assembly factor-like uncharacterized protein